MLSVPSYRQRVISVDAGIAKGFLSWRDDCGHNSRRDVEVSERDVCWTDWSALLVSGPESERFWSTSSQQKREQLERIQEQVAKGEVGYTSRSVDPQASCCEILS
jgi:hypothetical protein